MIKIGSRQRLCLAVSVLASMISSLAPAGEILVEKNLEYIRFRTGPLKLNLARPKEGMGPFPCILWIPGDRWADGSAEDFQEEIEESARRGFVGVSVGYRLTDSTQDRAGETNSHATQVFDCKSAIRWLRRNAAKYRIDPERIGATGASAGGHLSLMLGATGPEDNLEIETTGSSRVQAVANVGGPTDLMALHADVPAMRPFLEGLCAAKPDADRIGYLGAGPLIYLSRDDPPILTIHGGKDEIVPVRQAKLLDERSRKKGVSHTLKILDNQGHNFDAKARAEANEMIFEFFDKHLKEMAPAS
jgi:acetyl esterase/lipase